MPLCILCSSEATETSVEAGKLVNCPWCHPYKLANGLAIKLAKESEEFRRELGRALRWRFYRGEPGDPPPTLRSVKISCKSLIEALRESEEDPDKREQAALDALEAAGSSANAFDIPVMRPLGRKLGLSHDESCAYARDLRTGKKVDIVPCYISQTPPPGEKSFDRSEQWVRCEKKDEEQSEGK
jgi:hypothetical protein